jgi:DNA recombination protein RmuC
MTPEFNLPVLLVLALLVALLVLLLMLLRRAPDAVERQRVVDDQNAQAQQATAQLRQELRHDLRQELMGSSQHIEQALRAEMQGSARDNRQELMQGLSLFQQQLLAQAAEVARGQNEQIDSFRTQLASMQAHMAAALQTLAHSTSDTLARQSQAGREAQDGAFQRLVDSQSEALQRVAHGQADALQRFGQVQTEQLRSLSEASGQSQSDMRAAMEQRLASLQGAVEQRLLALQADNEKKLEQMRVTVDEKLHATLEQRLGESFRQVAGQLEQVHRGLGEMQALAQGVGDLKRVLGNVKSRGVFGEVQLANLLEQVFTIDQYATNVATVPGSNERVEFAIRLPGKLGSGGDQPLWLPIDAKFPREDYERLLDAQDRADKDGAEVAGRALEQRIRDEARTIAAKYVAPPHTTDFAMLFLPTEGLYAELLRRPGLSDDLQRKHRVILAGPTTLLAMLNSLQMGFRTLALEKRSSEVWQVLGAVKTEFGKFGDVLEKTKKKLQEASNSIESAEVRTRAMARQLRGVEAMDSAGAQALLGLDAEPPLLPGDATLPAAD